MSTIGTSSTLWIFSKLETEPEPFSETPVEGKINYTTLISTY